MTALYSEILWRSNEILWLWWNLITMVKSHDYQIKSYDYGEILWLSNEILWLWWNLMVIKWNLMTIVKSYDYQMKFYDYGEILWLSNEILWLWWDLIAIKWNLMTMVKSEFLVPNFSLNRDFWFFGSNLPKMGVPVKSNKNIRIILSTIFQL